MGDCCISGQLAYSRKRYLTLDKQARPIINRFLSSLKQVTALFDTKNMFRSYSCLILCKFHFYSCKQKKTWKETEMTKLKRSFSDGCYRLMLSWRHLFSKLEARVVSENQKLKYLHKFVDLYQTLFAFLIIYSKYWI